MYEETKRITEDRLDAGGTIVISKDEKLGTREAVPQLILTAKKSLLLGVEALFVFLFLAFLDCWTASRVEKLMRSYLYVCYRNRPFDDQVQDRD
jgi:hypothetical protein